MVTHTPKYDYNTKLHFREDKDVLEGVGDAMIWIGESTIGVEVADPLPRIYAYHCANTTPVTGTAKAIQANCRVTVASPSGTLRGADILSGNGNSSTTGVNLGTMTGMYCGVALKGNGATCTVSNARGIECVNDLNGDAYNVVSEARGAWIIMRTGNATITLGDVLRLENEAVAGSGQKLNSAIKIVGTSVSPAFDCLIDASDVQCAVTSSDIVTLIKFKNYAGAAKALVYDGASLTVV